ncbi:hypothetical protein SHI21_06075 [Bacteriovorax sp. PP10]|uniref:Uncharacterized protein n=1 Tax=Bacteriovorax antarcticus TaxID=3088717 RepID=A0ABU5VRX8_9BACT|nr:hypothetical protein [Bacteriovorax sp. PP10]MEA9355756.1 hypothetical protein [Bacteriovorax sp. PP10]
MNRIGLINFRSRLSRINLISLLATLVVGIGCVPNNHISITSQNPKKIASTSTALNATVSNIEVINHQIVITGLNLDTVSAFEIKEGATTTNLSIESKTSTKIIANTLANVTFAAGKIFDFILSNASAAATYTVNFSLCDSTLGGQGFNCTPPTDKQVLSYDAVSGKWKPRSVNGLNYKGAWDPTPGTFPVGASAGDYFISNDDANGYFVGDWIVYNGATYDHISNSSAIISVYGRTGAVVAQEGDYNLDKLSDVDLTTTPPTLNQALVYNGTKWIPGTVSTTETDPTVKAFAKVVLPTCTVSEVLSSDGTSLGCVTDQAGAGVFSGTANRIVTTNGSGALDVTTISDTVLGYLSGATSNIQTQINAKLDWAVSGVATIHPSRLNLTVPNAGKAVITDGSGFITVSPTTSTQLGYLSGVTSSVQTQLDTKISAETDPSVTAFAKAALPTCAAGEVLKANGTVLSCVVDNAGAGSYTGGNNFVVVTNGSGALSDSTITTTKLGYLSGVTSDIQTQLGTKQATIDKTTTQAVSKVRIYGANATNYVELTTGTLTGNRTLTFPDSDGSNGYVLSTDGSGVLSWIAAPSGVETDPTVKAFAKAVLPTCTAGQFLQGDGTNVTCVTGVFSGTANRIVTTDGSGALAVTTISDTVLGYLSGVTSNVQTQLDAKASSASIVDWSSAGVAPTIDPSRLTLGVGNAGKAVITNGSGLLAASATTATQIGYLSNVTSDIQTQINSKAAAYAGGNNFVIVTNGSGALSDSTITTTKLGYLSGVTSDIQTQLGTKQATIDKTTTQDVSKVRIYGANATNYVELTTGALTGNRTLTFPDSNGTSGYVLSTDGAGILSWVANPSSPISTVFGRTGAVVATAGDYTAAQITNTAAGNIAATTAQAAINELDTEKQNISTFAADVRAIALTGISFVTSTAVTATDTILAAFGKLQAQISANTTSISGKADTTNIAQTITANAVTGLTAPSVAADAANKGYVDTNFVANAGGAASVQIGTLAARPVAAAGNTGRMYVVSDTGNEAIYVSTGSAWIKIASNSANGTIALANGGTGSTSFTGNKSVVVNSGGTALVDGPSIDDTTAVAATLVKRGAGGEVYGQYVVPTTTVTENAACTVPVGTIAKDSAGNLLTCQ